MTKDQLYGFMQQKQDLINHIFETLKRDVDLELISAISHKMRTLISTTLEMNSRMEEFAKKKFLEENSE